MKISYNWLNEYINLKDVSAEKVAEFLTLHSFEVESVVKMGGDWILDVAVLPNRGHDCRCHLGVAMDLAAILNKKPNQSYQTLKTQSWRLIKSSLPCVIVKVDPLLNLPSQGEGRKIPRYAALVIKNVKVGLSPQWLKERLKAIGLRPINNLVDLTNYLMSELGQPMHAFDYDKIRALSRNSRKILPFNKGESEGVSFMKNKTKVLPFNKGENKTKTVQITVRLSKKGEKVITLDGIERGLPAGVLVIEAGGQLIDLAGIMGGQLSEIGSETQNIILQAACFDGPTIRRATKILSHRTDASDIYQNNIDPNLADLALGRAWYLLKELAGGQVVQEIDIYPIKRQPAEIVLDLKKVRRLLGINLSRQKIIQILKSLDFGVSGDRRNVPRHVPTKETLLVKISTRRLDINIPEDLIEEIGRIYGYQKIKPEMPQVRLRSQEINEVVAYKNQIRQILVNLGFDEVMNYVFQPGVETRRGVSLQKALVPLQNPISREKTHLRISLLPGLIENLRANLKNFSQMQLFEIGDVFSNQFSPFVKGRLGGVREKENLAGIIFLPEKEIFFRLKGIIDTLLERLGMADVWYDNALTQAETVAIPNLIGNQGVFNNSAIAQIKIGDKIIGYLGEVKESFSGQTAAGFEIDLAGLVQEVTEERMYQPPAKYPAAVRDLALLVPSETKVADVLNEIEAVNIPELIDVDLFDIYEGEQTGERKNLAFHLIFQSPDHTLSDREVDKIMMRLMQALEKNQGWQVRK